MAQTSTRADWAGALCVRMRARLQNHPRGQPLRVQGPQAGSRVVAGDEKAKTAATSQSPRLLPIATAFPGARSATLQ
jgi:hypothetical protein